MYSAHLKGRTLQAFLLVAAVLLALSTLLTAVVYQPVRVSAAQVTSRSITLGSSAANAETTYRIQFTVPDNGVENIGSFRVEFCDNNPLPNQTCTFTVGDNVPQVDSNAGSIATLSGSPTFNGIAISMTAPSVGDRFLDFTLASTTDIGAATAFDVTVNNVDNPDNSSSGNNNDSFYARIYVYSSTTPPAAANPMPTTNQNNDGGVALSTAEQLTVQARVQEILQFCVGTDDAGTNNDCSDISGNVVDLGVLTNSAVNVTPVATSSGGNNKQGLAMIRTNASNGAVIGYLAEQDSTGTNHLGALRVAGATCNAGTVATDQCINSVGTTEAAINAGTENFGMTVAAIDTTNGTTANVVRDAEYDGNVGYAWDETGTFDQIATSSTVIDDELLPINFAATSNITTPTGFYTVTVTFIATPTF